jgi:hypothetical protein
MSELIKRHKEMLNFLSSAKPAGVKAVMKTASPELVRTLCEFCLNVLEGNVPLTACQNRRMHRYKTIIVLVKT